MNEEVFKKLFPDEYVERFLKEKTRLDGRSFLENRNIMIQKRKKTKKNLKKSRKNIERGKWRYKYPSVDINRRNDCARYLSLKEDKKGSLGDSEGY